MRFSSSQILSSSRIQQMQSELQLQKTQLQWHQQVNIQLLEHTQQLENQIMNYDQNMFEIKSLQEELQILTGEYKQLQELVQYSLGKYSEFRASSMISNNSSYLSNNSTENVNMVGLSGQQVLPRFSRPATPVRSCLAVPTGEQPNINMNLINQQQQMHNEQLEASITFQEKRLNDLQKQIDVYQQIIETNIEKTFRAANIIELIKQLRIQLEASEKNNLQLTIQISTVQEKHIALLQIQQKFSRNEATYKQDILQLRIQVRQLTAMLSAQETEMSKMKIILKDYK
ncbi:Hypothetical_protein [Hexamita inflata]|uniref:Hypothetical_protein n=1 Tax=Hexamita inflata TaxID=28002 RepID=A0AA86RBF2_9EUKA|nr:Hypothetical protein HINF_LOCUS58481 [Hexamita inflata]